MIHSNDTYINLLTVFTVSISDLVLTQSCFFSKIVFVFKNIVEIL